MEKFERVGGSRGKVYGCHLSEREPGKIWTYMTSGANNLSPAEVREWAYELLLMATEAEKVGDGLASGN